MSGAIRPLTPPAGGPRKRVFCRKPPIWRGVERPCRRCDLCLKRRQAEWAEGTLWEFRQAKATWWQTLTFADPVPPVTEARRLVGAHMRSLRNSGHEIRYSVVEEHGGQTGRLHYHALICSAGPLRYRDVVLRKGGRGRKATRRWTHGRITHCALVRDAGGVSKYLAKYSAKGGRLTASNGWGGEGIRPYLEGRATPEAYQPILAAVFAAFPGATIKEIREPGGSRHRLPWRLVLAERRKQRAEEKAQASAALASDLWCEAEETREEMLRSMPKADRDNFLRLGGNAAQVGRFEPRPDDAPQGELFADLIYQDRGTSAREAADFAADWKARMGRKPSYGWGSGRPDGLSWDDERGQGVGEGGDEDPAGLWFPDEDRE